MGFRTFPTSGLMIFSVFRSFGMRSRCTEMSIANSSVVPFSSLGLGSQVGSRGFAFQSTDYGRNATDCKKLSQAATDGRIFGCDLADANAVQP